MRFGSLKGGEVIFERLLYNRVEACAGILTIGFSQEYQDALTTGVWPLEDVLPQTLRRWKAFECLQGDIDQSLAIG